MIKDDILIIRMYYLLEGIVSLSRIKEFDYTFILTHTENFNDLRGKQLKRFQKINTLIKKNKASLFKQGKAEKFLLNTILHLVLNQNEIPCSFKFHFVDPYRKNVVDLCLCGMNVPIHYIPINAICKKKKKLYGSSGLISLNTYLRLIRILTYNIKRPSTKQELVLLIKDAFYMLEPDAQKVAIRMIEFDIIQLNQDQLLCYYSDFFDNWMKKHKYSFLNLENEVLEECYNLPKPQPNKSILETLEATLPNP